jgi:hypothetical protein
MDVKYGLTSNLTLNASLNPDFGQVEADPSEVNLTAFETRFAERRPLFLEGADIFNVPVGEDWWGGERVFYSRRIGRPPQRRVAVPGGFVDAPSSTTLLGAAKLSGKTAGGWSIGVLDVVTAREEARTLDAEGRAGRETVEPLTNHAVVRVKKDFREGGSGVGAVFTAANRRLGSGDELAFLRSAAYVGGLDARHRFGGGDYLATATVLASRVQGSALAIDRTQRSSVRYFQRPDATHVTYDPTRTTLSGVAAAATVRKNGGNWRGALDGMVRSPGFEINDLGFQRLADRISEASFVGYQQFRPGSVFRRWRVDVFQYAQWNFGGDRLENAVGTDNNFQLLNYWGGYLGVERLFPGLSTDLLRGGPAVRTPARVNLWTGLNTDSRRPLSGRVNLNLAREEETGGAFLRVEPGATYRPSARLELSLAPATAWNTVPWQFVAARAAGGETHHVVGRLEQRTVSLTGRLNYTFLPNLSLQTYVQPFISAGTYTAFQEARRPRAPRPDDRFAPLTAGALAYDAAGRALPGGPRRRRHRRLHLRRPRLQRAGAALQHRAAVGVPARIGAVRGLEPGAQRHRPGRPLPPGPRRGAAPLRGTDQRAPGEVQLLAGPLIAEPLVRCDSMNHFCATATIRSGTPPDPPLEPLTERPTDAIRCTDPVHFDRESHHSGAALEEPIVGKSLWIQPLTAPGPALPCRTLVRSTPATSFFAVFGPHPGEMHETFGPARQLAAAHGGTLSASCTARAARLLGQLSRRRRRRRSRATRTWRTSSRTRWCALSNAEQRHVGPGPHRPARAAAERDVRVRRDRLRRERVHHRHRHPVLAQRLRRARQLRLRRLRSGGNGNDCNGHGTHVAGTTGGTTWGVAKGVKLVAVRVLDCRARARRAA